MRIGLFLLLSLALHTTALTYPVLFLTPQVEELVPVIVLGLEVMKGDEVVTGGRAEAKRSRPAELKHPVSAKKAPETSGVIQETTEQKPAIRTFVYPVDVPEGAAVASDRNSSSSDIDFPAGNGGGVSQLQGTGSGGEGLDGNSGEGNSVGGGLGGAGPGFVQVSYVYNPKPHYPERAREEGREGTVILRVLVDGGGKVGSIEVNRSSGFEAFDRAAIDAVTGWRFSPARYGERRVESWVRIPVVFRLTDVRD
jgi:protein TonB